MQLTSIQYTAIMMAIQLGFDAINNDTFLDPYGEQFEGVNNETLAEALKQVETMIMSVNIPD